MDPELNLRNLRKLVWDCHNPVFGIKESYETFREENMWANYRESANLFKDLTFLQELVLILDWRPGSKILDFVRTLDFGHLKFVGESEIKGTAKREIEKDGESVALRSRYVLKELRWVAQ